MKKTTVWETRQRMEKPDYELFHYYDSYVKEVKLHHHDFYEIYYFVSGSVVYTVEGRLYDLKSGDILLISPSELHQLTATESAPYERIVLWLSSELLEKLSTKNTRLFDMFEETRKVGNNLLSLPPQKSARIFNLLEEIASLKNSAAFGDDLIASARLSELLVLIGSEKLKTDENEYQPVKDILTYINKNLTDCELDVAKIAEASFISASRLAHLFKAALGTSVYQYIIKKRLVLAKEYLSKGDAVIDLYAKCGFREYVGFFRTFKQEYGITPKEYYYSVKSAKQ